MDYKEKVIALLNSQELSKEQKEKLENIFPELKESEDEKIRKALISLINEGRNGKAFIEIHGVPVADILAWLESKDIKNKVWIYRDVYVREKEHARKDGIDEVLANPQKYGLEKQGEQKPAEWSEDDETVLSNLIWALKEDMVLAGDRDEYVSWLQSLKDKTIPQPKSAWSEEDKKILKDIITDVKFEGYNNDMQANSYKKISWLKHLKDRVQPQQKWSEEDEYILGEVITHLEEYIRLDKENYSGEDVEYYKRDINWLKSIKDRYTWKPSDEQMEALANALSLAKNCGEESAFDLRTLYEQLNKLK